MTHFANVQLFETHDWGTLRSRRKPCVSARRLESQEGGPVGCLGNKVLKDRCVAAEPIAKAFVAVQSDTQRYLQKNGEPKRPPSPAFSFTIASPLRASY